MSQKKQSYGQRILPAFGLLLIVFILFCVASVKENGSQQLNDPWSLQAGTYTVDLYHSMIGVVLFVFATLIAGFAGVTVFAIHAGKRLYPFGFGFMVLSAMEVRIVRAFLEAQLSTIQWFAWSCIIFAFCGLLTWLFYEVSKPQP